MSARVLSVPFGDRQALQRPDHPKSRAFKPAAHRAVPSCGTTSPMHTASEKLMRKSGGNSPKLGEINPHTWGRVLRLRHPAKTADCVAAATGVPARTVEKWLDGTSSPSASAFLRLILAYGPGLLAEVVPAAPSWLSAAARAERIAALEAEHARLAGEIDRLQVRE